jgi:hypothetical protein
VGFEPTVGCPTLDFESSALNRTQPPFPIGRYCRSYFMMRNCRTRLRVCKGKALLDLAILGGCYGRNPSLSCRASPPNRKFLKNVTILGLPKSFSLLHIVCPQGRLRYYLLLTGIHRLLAPLFTIIRTLFRTSTLHHRHDSTKTRNSASLT